MATIVWAPGNLVIASNEGVDVRLAGVEVTAATLGHPGQVPGERVVKVDLAGVTTAATMDLDHAYNQALEEWVEERRRIGADKAGHSPVMPGDAVLNVVRAVVTDNHDTDYRQVAGRVAGTGSEWEATWMFAPEPPAGVKHLTIEFTVNGELTGKSVRVQLD